MLVESDMSLINLNLSEIEMTDMTRYDLKIEVKKRTRDAAINYLTNLKMTKSKMDGIEYSGPFDLQPYLQSPMFTREESSLLLALRTLSVRGVRSDFGEMYSDKTCPLTGCMEPDSLAHILVCSVLSSDKDQTAQYSDVFSSSEELQWAVTARYRRLLAERERLLEPRQPDETV